MGSHLPPLSFGARPEDAKALCVFVHGRTQSPEAMVEQILGHLTVTGIAYILPRADGNQWYAARATDPLTDATRGELDVSLAYLRGIVDGFIDAGQADKPLLIGGFSQGACLTMEYAMRFGPWRGAMANLTGCRVGQAHDDRSFCDLDGMPVYLTGSDADPWIPVHAFAEATHALGKARAKLRCDLFPGREHKASGAEVAAIDAMLADLADGKLPFA